MRSSCARVRKTLIKSWTRLPSTTNSATRNVNKLSKMAEKSSLFLKKDLKTNSTSKISSEKYSAIKVI